jgi:hypothetical protein
LFDEPASIVDISISLDGVDCTVLTWTAPGTPGDPATITCETGARIGEWDQDPLMEFFVNDAYVATGGLKFYYVSRWSDDETWGASLKPAAGESVSVPRGRHLLVDEDPAGALDLVILDGGSMLFPCDPSDPSTNRLFDANYIFINAGGYFEVGTEENPYCSQIDICMHGTKYSPQVPVYGNKGIFVRGGTLSMHGMPRTPTWTTLAQTAYYTNTAIALSDDPAIDWQPGEKILITGTD